MNGIWCTDGIFERSHGITTEEFDNITAEGMCEEISSGNLRKVF